MIPLNHNVMIIFTHDPPAHVPGPQLDLVPVPPPAAVPQHQMGAAAPATVLGQGLHVQSDIPVEEHLAHPPLHDGYQALGVIGAQCHVGYSQPLTVDTTEHWSQVTIHAGNLDNVADTHHQAAEVPGRHQGDVQVLQNQVLDVCEVAVSGEGGTTTHLRQGGDIAIQKLEDLGCLPCHNHRGKVK